MTVTIKFNESELSEQAAELLAIVRGQSAHMNAILSPRDGVVSVDIKDHPDSDDVFCVRVRSLLSWRERALKFGVPALESSQVARDANDNPVAGKEAGTYVPNEEFLVSRARAYGDALRHGATQKWEVPYQIIGTVRHGKITPNAACMNRIAGEFWQWCKDGEFEPVMTGLPRGRNGRRPTIGEEPLKRRNVMVSDADWEYLQHIGESASDGIRKAIEAHREGDRILVKKLTDDWVAMMSDQTRWDTFEGQMVAVGSFPIGIDAADERVVEIQKKIMSRRV